jgi:hypothetical protein
MTLKQFTWIYGAAFVVLWLSASYVIFHFLRKMW